MGSPPPIQFATLGMWDTLLLMVLALVVFGPRRLPMIGRQLGKLMYEFRKASNDFKFQMEEELRTSEEADRRKKAEEERQRALAAAPPAAQLEATTSQPQATAAETLATDETQQAATTQESGAPVLTESPYSEGTDPNIGAQATNRAEAPPSKETSPPETAQPETAPPAGHSTDPESHPAPAAAIPHIQPPSTGEKIAANPPGKTQGSLFPEAEGSEPANHHD